MHKSTLSCSHHMHTYPASQRWWDPLDRPEPHIHYGHPATTHCRMRRHACATTNVCNWKQADKTMVIYKTSSLYAISLCVRQPLQWHTSDTGRNSLYSLFLILQHAVNFGYSDLPLSEKGVIIGTVSLYPKYTNRYCNMKREGSGQESNVALCDVVILDVVISEVNCINYATQYETAVLSAVGASVPPQDKRGARNKWKAQNTRQSVHVGRHPRPTTECCTGQSPSRPTRNRQWTPAFPPPVTGEKHVPNETWYGKLAVTACKFLYVNH